MDQSIDESDIPNEFYCPIFQQIMKDPVITVDGFTFERQAIQQWFNKNKITNPITGVELQSKNLLPNRALKQVIQHYYSKKSKDELNKSKNITPIKKSKSKQQVQKALQIIEQKAKNNKQWLQLPMNQALKVFKLLPPTPKGTQSQQELQKIGNQAYQAFGINVTNKKKVYANKRKNKVYFSLGLKNDILWYFNGEIYFGQIVRDYEGKIAKQGRGFMLYPNKFAYRGQFKEGKRNGFGIGQWLKNQDGETKYEGNWVDGKQNGYGTLQSRGNISESNFKNGLREGFGKILYRSGDLYQGNFVNDVFEGKGKFTWKNGNIYQGDYKKGKKQGIGILKRKSHKQNQYDIYQGSYKDGKKNGYGVYTWFNGTVYQGEFKDNHRLKGVIKYTNGKIQKFE